MSSDAGRVDEAAEDASGTSGSGLALYRITWDQSADQYERIVVVASSEASAILIASQLYALVTTRKYSVFMSSVVSGDYLVEKIRDLA